MTAFGVINKERIDEIAKELSFPSWLVEALIVEYLPCRRFLDEGVWVLFDYSSVTTRDVEGIVKPYAVMNNITLFHNVTRDVLQTRILHGMVGRTMVPIGEPSVFLAEGRVSPSLLPFFQNPASVVDWKLSPGIHSIVVEGDAVYQWAVSEFVHIPNKNRGWFTSEIYSQDQLNKLRNIHDEVYDTISSQPPTDESLVVETRSHLEQLYNNLAVVKNDMRKSVLDYHERTKKEPKALLGYTEDSPPTLTIFDQLRVAESSLQVRSYVEPLFLRAAIRAHNRAVEAHNKVKMGEVRAITVTEEIEAAAEAIILCAMCLEAYINGIIQDYLSDLAASIEQMQVQTKWLVVPRLLGHQDCFSKSSMPYQAFAQLISWRNNDLAHYKHQFHKPQTSKEMGSVSRIYAICNAGNSATALNTVQAMVTRLSTCLSVSVPSWLGVTSEQVIL